MTTLSGNAAQSVYAITTTMTATGNSTDIYSCPIRVLSAQATVKGTGTVSATVNLQASLDGLNFVTIKTFGLSGTTSATDLALLDSTFQYYQANVSAISGTSAQVSVYIKT